MLSRPLRTLAIDLTPLLTKPLISTRCLHCTPLLSRRRNKEPDPDSNTSKRRAKGRPREKLSGVKTVSTLYKVAPTTDQLRVVLAGRLNKWVTSLELAHRLRNFGLNDGLSARCLSLFEKEVMQQLKGKRKDESDGVDNNVAEEGNLEGWDVKRLTMALQLDDDWRDTINRSYLRRFVEWLVEGQQQQQQPNTPKSSSKEKDKDPRSRIPPPTLSKIQRILDATDLTHRSSDFAAARQLRRHFHLHIGPTNSGKTYNALKALVTAKRGAYAGPLRLLAHEVWDRINRGTVGGLTPGNGRPCNLVTGEEKRVVSLFAGMDSCTVEMLPLETLMDVVVIDEIQMLGDGKRGASWTQAVMGMCSSEIHLCGEETVTEVIRKLVDSMGDELTIHRYERLTPLQIAEESLGGDLARIEDGDCVVAFSRSEIFQTKKVIEEKTGKRCAIVYGALPPETRSEQARLFNEEGNGVNVMVASDAVGMGLNLKIKRMIFESMHKWDGRQEVELSHSQVKQIAGRAGRYGQGSSDGGGLVTTLRKEDLPILREILPSPPVAIPRAVIEPSFERLQETALLLDPDTPFSELLSIVIDLAKIPPLCMPADVQDRVKIASILGPLNQQLTFAEVNSLTFAPVNHRDPNVTAVFFNWVQQFSEFSYAEVVRGLSTTRLLENLETIEAVKEAMPDPVKGGLYPTIPPSVVNTIPLLESLHKAVVLYIWLSYRFELAFEQRTEALALKERAEVALDFCLARLPGMHPKKAKRVKFTKDHEETMARPSTNESKDFVPLSWIPHNELSAYAFRDRNRYQILE